jgi:1-deoxy-D-xylulose-5-phosphate reductoisomerase
VLIAADDVAVARFLDGSLDFPGIARLLDDAVARFGSVGDAAPGLEELVALDAEVRAAFGAGTPAPAGASSPAVTREGDLH